MKLSSLLSTTLLTATTALAAPGKPKNTRNPLLIAPSQPTLPPQLVPATKRSLTTEWPHVPRAADEIKAWDPLNASPSTDPPQSPTTTQKSPMTNWPHVPRNKALTTDWPHVPRAQAWDPVEAMPTPSPPKPPTTHTSPTPTTSLINSATEPVKTWSIVTAVPSPNVISYTITTHLYPPSTTLAAKTKTVRDVEGEAWYPVEVRLPKQTPTTSTTSTSETSAASAVEPTCVERWLGQGWRRCGWPE